MKLTLFVLSSLLASTSAIPTQKRDATSIASAVEAVRLQVLTLSQVVSTFNKGDLDGIIKVLKIQKQSNAVSDAVTSAISAAQESSPLDGDGSNKVAASVLALQPNLTSFLTTLESKKPAFDTVILGIGSVSPQIEQTLQQQNASSYALGEAITEKLASPYKDFAPLITGQIIAAFNQAIQTFQTPGGLFAVPASPTLEALENALSAFL